MGLQNYWTVRFHWQNNLVYILPFTCLCRVGRGDLFLSRERHYTSPFGASVMSFSRKKSIPTPNETETRKFYVSGLTLTVLSVENLKLKAWPIVTIAVCRHLCFSGSRHQSSTMTVDVIELWRHLSLAFDIHGMSTWYVGETYYGCVPSVDHVLILEARYIWWQWPVLGGDEDNS